MGSRKDELAATPDPTARQSDRTGTSDRARAGRGKLLWSICILAATVLAVGMWLAVGGLRPEPDRPGPPELPELPDLTGQPAALADHLRRADRAARDDPTSSDAVGALGTAYHADGFYDRAAACYDLARKLDRGDWRWHYYAALIQEELGATRSSAECLRETVALNPDFVPAWFRLGRAEQKSARYDAAEKAYRRVLSIDRKRSSRAAPEAELPGGMFPLSTYASHGLAQVALRHADVDRAREILEGLTKAHPKFGSAHRLLAEIYRDLDRSQDAARQLALAASCGPYAPPDDPMIDELLLRSCNATFLLKENSRADRAKSYRRAEWLARRAVEVNDEDADAVCALGLALLRLRLVEDATPYLERYRHMVPDDGQVLAKTGFLLLSCGRTKESIEYLQKSVQVEPNNALSHNNLGFALTRVGKSDQAILHFKRAVEINPAYAEAHSNLGDVLASLERFDQAFEHYQRALEVNPQDSIVYNRWGRTLVRLGRLDQAIQQFQKAVTANPDNLDAGNNLAWLLATAPQDTVRDGARAVELAKQLCEAAEYRDTRLLDTLAAAYAEAGDFSQAIAIATKARERAGPRQRSLARRIGQRLELYRAGKPYRDKP